MNRSPSCDSPPSRVRARPPAGSLRWQWQGQGQGQGLWPWLCLCACPIFSLPALAAAAPDQVVRFDQAAFRQLDSPAPADWQTVALPDTWGARGLPLARRGHYRLQLPLLQAPQGVWALRIDRLRYVHSMHLNGLLVPQRGQLRLARGEPQVMSVLVQFPAMLLQAGDNHIDVQWRLAARAGMSAPALDPSGLLQPGYDRARLQSCWTSPCRRC